MMVHLAVQARFVLTFLPMCMNVAIFYSLTSFRTHVVCVLALFWQASKEQEPLDGYEKFEKKISQACFL
jgi:hypothetical protein